MNNIVLKTREEIELMRESALMVSRTLGIIAREIKPGVVPAKLDKLAEEYIRDNGGTPVHSFPTRRSSDLGKSVV